jgi:hypothetical protein
VVDDICWQCTPDAEVIKLAGAILSRGVVMTGKAYEAIGVELERIVADSLERAELAAMVAAGASKLEEWPPAGSETEDPLERPATLLTAAHEDALRRWWSYPCSFGFEYHGEMTEEDMRAILGIPASMDLQAPSEFYLEDVELEDDWTAGELADGGSNV